MDDEGPDWSGTVGREAAKGSAVVLVAFVLPVVILGRLYYFPGVLYACGFTLAIVVYFWGVIAIVSWHYYGHLWSHVSLDTQRHHPAVLGAVRGALGEGSAERLRLLRRERETFQVGEMSVVVERWHRFDRKMHRTVVYVGPVGDGTGLERLKGVVEEAVGAAPHWWDAS